VPRYIPVSTDGPFGLHKPGWRIALGGSERDLRLRDSQRKEIEKAHADAEYRERVSNAYRSTDARGR